MTDWTETHRETLQAMFDSQTLLDAELAAISAALASLAALEATKAKYDELIYAVESKYPNETRHETALRYIRQRETPSGEAAQQRQAALRSAPDLGGKP